VTSSKWGREKNITAFSVELFRDFVLYKNTSIAKWTVICHFSSNVLKGLQTFKKRYITLGKSIIHIINRKINKSSILIPF
jgi:hypothetical protein